MQHVVDEIERISKEAVSQCHKYFATKEGLEREEKCKSLQKEYEIVKSNHQQSIQLVRDAMQYYSIDLKRLVEESERNGKVTQEQQRAIRSLALIFEKLRQINQEMLNQIKICQNYVAKEKLCMFGDGDYSMVYDAFERLCESFSWEKTAILAALKSLEYLLPPLGYMITAVGAIFTLVQVCYPIYLRKVASDQVAQLEEDLKGLEVEWLKVTENLNAIQDSMAN